MYTIVCGYFAAKLIIVNRSGKLIVLVNGILLSIHGFAGVAEDNLRRNLLERALQLYIIGFELGLCQTALHVAVCSIFQILLQIRVFCFQAADRLIVLLRLREKFAHLREKLTKQTIQLRGVLAGVQRIRIREQIKDHFCLLVQIAGLLEYSLQLRVLRDHMLPVPILPRGQAFPVPDDVLCREPSVLRDWDEREVHVRRLFIHVYHGRNDAIFSQLVFQKIHRMLEEGPDFCHIHTPEKSMARGDQRLHDPHAVAADPGAIVLLDQGLGHLAVAVSRLDDVKIVFAAAQIHVEIAGIFLLHALIVGLDVADLRPLVFGKAQNGVLGFIRQLSLLFCLVVASSVSLASA